jgi:hypothetical protein
MVIKKSFCYQKAIQPLWYPLSSSSSISPSRCNFHRLYINLVVLHRYVNKKCFKYVLCWVVRTTIMWESCDFNFENLALYSFSGLFLCYSFMDIIDVPSCFYLSFVLNYGITSNKLWKLRVKDLFWNNLDKILPLFLPAQ